MNMLCRHGDCKLGFPVADAVDDVTCPNCRDFLGLPSISIPVIVDGEICSTVMVQGVQRFRSNRIIEQLREVAKRYTGWDMNELCRDVANGRYSQVEYREFYRLIGYSVGGYCDVFGDTEILNPLWDEEEDEEPKNHS